MTVSYICEAGKDPTCPETCKTLEECAACDCVVDDEDGGPWGNAMDAILCLLPIVYLLFATLKKNPIPTTVSLPFSAFFLFLTRVMYLGSNPLLVCASVISGFHEALAPLSIMCGAIFLFETMESTLCMPFMLREMKALSKGHPVAETMLLFSFAYSKWIRFV
jgi:L-lactate permease